MYWVGARSGSGATAAGATAAATATADRGRVSVRVPTSAKPTAPSAPLPEAATLPPSTNATVRESVLAIAEAKQEKLRTRLDAEMSVGVSSALIGGFALSLVPEARHGVGFCCPVVVCRLHEL